ncbi:MAG TPA: hypothetical protein VEG42_04545 [Thermoplasmata archaeon]|nr:hypothetical protein [Thermoplasmata archaeon]
MIIGWIGRLFRSVARLRPSAAGDDLARVGEELLRLERRRAQLAATSR